MHWNTYNPIYIGEFDSFDRSDEYGVNGFRIKYTILKKNYVGPVSSLLCAGQPLVHRYLNDDPIAVVKGSEVEIKFLNVDRQTPLSLFYSEEDDTFKIKVERVTYPTNQVIFEGYLVQEDCTEVLVDHTHELSLVFTDNLGLLKNVKLDQGSRLVAKSEYFWRHYTNSVTKFTDYFEMLPQLDPGQDPMIGDTMILESDLGDTIYRVMQVRYTGSGLGARVRVWVDLAMPDVGNGSIFESVFFITPHNIQERMLLGDILKICLQNTGLLLNAFFANYATVQLADSTFTSRLTENIYIDCKTFKNGDNYDSLYEILEKILGRLTSSLFQARGVWKMHRWLELPMSSSNHIIAKFYNPYFVFQYSANTTWPMQYGNLSDIQTGALETIVRPLKYVRNTFNFEQPTDMLFNYKLDYLGEFIREYTYTDGSETFLVKVYEVPGWQNNLGSPFMFNPRDLRIVYNSVGEEKDRFIAAQFNPANSTVPAPPYINHRFVGSTNIEVNKGDKIKFSFDWKTPTPPAGSGPWTEFFTPLTLSTPGQEYRVATDGNWVIANDSFSVTFPAGTDWTQYQTITVETKPLPFDGLLTVWLWNRNGLTTNEEYYKNFNFEYIPYMDGREDVKRQQHTATLQGTIKNNVDTEIAIDDTTKNYAKGTLFLPTFTNIIQDKTAVWRDGVASRNAKLGEIITKEMNLWRYMQRGKIELTLWPLLKFETLLSMDTVIDYQLKSGFFYIFGKLEIDYKANQAKGTMYEIYNPIDSELIIDGIDRLSRLDYEFQYLFK